MIINTNVNDGYPYVLNVDIAKPYVLVYPPSIALWRENPNVNDGYPYTSLVSYPSLQIITLASHNKNLFLNEIYDTIDSTYEIICKSRHIKNIFKIEFLDHYENPIGINYVSENIQSGQISLSSSNGTRASCSLTLYNYLQNNIPSQNSEFWYNRKFKIYIGVESNGYRYLFSKGVFLTQSISLSVDSKSLDIDAVDKFSLWDGSLNVKMCRNTYKVSAGVSISQMIKQTLMLDMGNGVPIDPIRPIIDSDLDNIMLAQDIVIDAGNYLGDIFTKIAEMYKMDTFYNQYGNLVIINSPDYNLVPSNWHYDDIDSELLTPKVNFGMDNINVVMVSTDSTTQKNYSYVAKNNNPISPLCIENIGEKVEPPIKIVVPNTNDVRGSQQICKDTAEYYLNQKKSMTIKVTFNSTVIPHLNVQDIVSITNEYLGYIRQKFVVLNITLPIGDGSMDVTVSNLNWLPTYNYDL